MNPSLIFFEIYSNSAVFMEKLKKQFDAVDQSGQHYRILIYQQYVPIKTRAGTEWAEGGMFAETSTGISLNYIDDETFEIDRTGQVLKKVGERD